MSENSDEEGLLCVSWDNIEGEQTREEEEETREEEAKVDDGKEQTEEG